MKPNQQNHNRRRRIWLMAASASLGLAARLYCQTSDSFNPQANWDVYAMVVQADGKILVGGDFTTLSGQPRKNFGRLNTDGTLDTSFNPTAGGFSSTSVRALGVQVDTKSLVGVAFTSLGGQACTNIGRVNPDGTLDTTFNPGADNPWYPSVNCLVLQGDGKIL